MICKERDASQQTDNDIFSQAGAKAEEQMAFYLRREFGSDPEVWVFNDLRFETESGDAAQIDHLVLHRSGFILVESKSVTSKVRARANGEWERIWNNHWQFVGKIRVLLEVSGVRHEHADQGILSWSPRQTEAAEG